jgi:hypothetical protein
MQDFEKLGVFYLGREFDLASGRTADGLVLYDAKDLTTHAVCVGMTGSGKTGLGITLLEEAAIDGIPALVIDPKGDMGNLLLNFPELRSADFEPWIDAGEAQRKGKSVSDFAHDTAQLWSNGLQQWGQDGARVKRLRDCVDMAIYTPGSSAGLPITVLRSFDPPDPDVRDDAEARGEKIQTAVGGLLSLLGIEADAIKSREAILLSNILQNAWGEGRGLSLSDLVREVQAPRFDKLGVLDLETFFPAKERAPLALAINALLAAPDFQPWLEGEPLDVQRLLWTQAGKPRLSILSIAHLSDAQRMSFVTVLLGEVVSWMRRQSGTGSLRAIVYMDEIFGFFPPSAEPPSKRPMLTLLKQARAFGLGIVLATQNPVDLDYKGLANAGTWFIGRLQTERDKDRLLDGLAGASAASGAKFDRASMDRLLSGLGSRVFLMNNAHEDAPVVFHTRWALSYLRGPLTKPQIQALMAPRKAAARSAAPGATPRATDAPPGAAAPVSASARAVVPAEVREVFLQPAKHVHDRRVVYRPSALAEARVHFVDAKSSVDLWQTVLVRAPISDLDALWEEASVSLQSAMVLDTQPVAGASFAELPGVALRPKSYENWAKAASSFLYQTRTLTLIRSKAHGLISRPEESLGDFKSRVQLAEREGRDADLEKLKQKYAPKLAAQQERIRRAEERVGREEEQLSQARTGSVITTGVSILGALLGRKLASSGNASRMGSAARSLGRTSKEKDDIARARRDLDAEKERMADLERQFQADAAAVHPGGESALEEVVIRPRKSDVAVARVSLLWTPFGVDSNGIAEPL